MNEPRQEQRREPTGPWPEATRMRSSDDLQSTGPNVERPNASGGTQLGENGRRMPLGWQAPAIFVEQRLSCRS